MKTKHLHLLLALGALASPAARAAVITTGDPAAGGITYSYQVQLGATDSGSFTSHAGAWSWEDNSLFNASNGEPPVGWTHTSNWVALTLSEPTTLTVRLERQEGVSWPGAGLPDRTASTASMFPSFTLWASWDNDDTDFHTYNNRGNVDWAEDLSYITHVDNSTETSVERSLTLPAGQYSLALGSNAPATDTNRQGYLATFSTAAVPEPSTYLLMGLGLALVFLSRKQARKTGN